MWQREEAINGAKPIVKLLKELRQTGHLKAVGWAGSIRRMKPVVHDVDIVASIASDHSQADVANLIKTKMGDALVGISGMEKALRFFLPMEGKDEPLQVDLMLVPEKSWGAAWMHMTGPAEFNIACRAKAKRKGWKLNQYGLFDASNTMVASKTEEDMFKVLGMEYKMPENR